MKGVLQPDHIALNSYQFAVEGLIPLTFTSLKGLKEETDKVDLPDRTAASGGRSGPIEFSAGCPMHHTAEMAALEVWLREGKDPVTPTYKKTVTVTFPSISKQGGRAYTLMGVWVTARTIPDFEMNNNGEMAEAEWMFSADEIIPI
jgi:hypothetical protein